MSSVPHRQVVLTIPQRLRAWCLYRRALTGEPALAVGIVGCIQTHGSLANWHPHIHMIVTDGGFRPDHTFVPWPARDTAQLTEACRRAVLRHFVRRGLVAREDAEAMLAWPHSGCHVPDGDVAVALRLARYCARNPVALECLEYDATARQVRYRSDKVAGPTAGTETVDLLEFLARLTAHIPSKHQVMTRYDGYYANRVRGVRRRGGIEIPIPHSTLCPSPADPHIKVHAQPRTTQPVSPEAASRRHPVDRTCTEARPTAPR